MSASAFIATMRSRGLYFQLEEGQLVIELEEGAARPTPEEKRRVQELRPEIITYLSGVDWTKVSLYQLDTVLEIVTPWSDINIVIAPGCRIARELRAKDAKPGRIWCVCEVIDLLLSGVKPEDARKVAETKLIFDGTITDVRQERRS